MMDRSKLPGIVPGKRHPDWAVLYQDATETSLPWHLDSLDPDFMNELTKGVQSQKRSVLDIGSGLGGQASLIQKMGFQVCGTDISKSAVERAAEKYPEVQFVVDDVCTTEISQKFDYVLDRGCFHVLEATEHANYLKSVRKLLKPGGVFLLKVFSSEMGNADFGPVRFSLPAIHRIFANQFEIIKIKKSTFSGLSTKSPEAWFLRMKGRDE